MENFIEFAPIIIVVASFFLQHRLFVTPEQLERKHRHILSEIEQRYAKVDALIDLKSQVCDIDEKITKLYDVVLQSLRSNSHHNSEHT